MGPEAAARNQTRVSAFVRSLRSLAQGASRTRLSTRLALLSAAVTAVVVWGGFWMLSVETRAGARRITSEELHRSQRTLIALQRRNMEQLAVTASLVTQRPDVVYTLSTYRLERNGAGVHRNDLVETLARKLEGIRRELDADVIVACDEEGRVISSVPPPPNEAAGTLRAGTALTALPAVRDALDPNAIPGNVGAGSLSVLRLGQGYFQVAASPVVLDGFTLGALVVGHRLDARYLAALRDSFDGEVVVASRGRIVLTSLNTATPAALVADIAAADSLTHTVRIGGNDYVMATIPLGETAEGARVELHLLQALTPVVRALTARLIPKFVSYGTVAVLVALLGALLLARTTLAPLNAFVRHMQAGAGAGKSPDPFDASRSAVEIRDLNASFEQLMSSLAVQRHELERRSEQLTAANDVLTQEIRERERIARALRESEAQLRQSQKLEAIGTLAGGIAHDFNNLLTVISGFTQLALSRFDGDHPDGEDLRQVADAAARAARLTHQLLAFSRKQVLRPQVLDLNAVIDGVQAMLRRLIGEHMELRIETAPKLARIKADPGQLEQVILNLVVNARDAMPKGGRITIETSTGTGSLDGCVVLRVSDTGVGMTEAVRERIFEPFFTTKEPGKGTGLGLSTVYGIVKQSGGTIDVESTLGKGTTFTIVLPPASEKTTPIAISESGEPPRGTETILLVEDEDGVRTLAQRVLENCGYRVLVAGGGVEALALARRYEDRIDLLLTDIVMPQINGPQLVERFMAAHPAPCVVYMSGYADDAIMQLEVDPGTYFLRKPFTPLALARAIREALDAARRSPRAFFAAD